MWVQIAGAPIPNPCSFDELLIPGQHTSLRKRHDKSKVSVPGNGRLIRVEFNVYCPVTTSHVHPFSSMQRFLEITELVEHVFEYSERSALAAFARTCHSLSELALDTLWGIHGDFNALMALLPDDIELEIADFTEYPASLSPVSLQTQPRLRCLHEI